MTCSASTLCSSTPGFGFASGKWGFGRNQRTANTRLLGHGLSEADMGRGAGGGRPKNKYDHRTIGCPLARRCSGWGCAWRGQADWRRACNQCGRRGDPREPIVSVLCHDPDLGINVLVADTAIFAFREEHADTARGLAARLSRRWNARPPPEAIALTGQREAVAEEGRRARRRSRLRKGPPSNRAMMLIMTTVTKRMMVVAMATLIIIMMASRRQCRR